VRPQPPNAAAHVALRRFSAVWAVSIAVKVAAIAVLLFVVWKLFGGF
jgi:hypothetical protein